MIYIDNVKVENTDSIANEFIKKWNSNENNFSFLTSGSSGEPKEIIHDRKTLNFIAEKVSELYGNEKRILFIFPPGSIAYSTMSLLPCLVNTKNELFLEKFNPFNFIQRYMELKPDICCIVPNMYRVLSIRKNWNELKNPNSIMIVGSDFVSNDMVNNLKDKEFDVRHVYGSTEVPPVLTWGNDTSFDFIKDVDYYIEDEELKVKWKCQKEYWSSGDLVEIIDDKKVKIKGRKNLFFKYDQFKIHPELIETIGKQYGATNNLCRMENGKIMSYFTGELNERETTEKINDYYSSLKNISIKIPVKFRQVEEIKTNPMNKIIRDQQFNV